ncbi:hypothetical protein CR513_44406, partial [Mucuna pruriens]
MIKTDERLKALETQISTLATLMTQWVEGPLTLLQIRPIPMEKEKVITFSRVPTDKEEGGPTKDEILTKEATTDVANEGKNVATPDQVRIPFSQSLKDEKDKEFTGFVEIFRKLHLNIPFIEAITQMANYAKFFIFIFYLIKRKVAHKLKDLGCFTISYTMDNSHFEKAQCDLGANINLINLACKNPNLLIYLYPCTRHSKGYPVILNMEADDTIPIILGSGAKETQLVLWPNLMV